MTDLFGLVFLAATAWWLYKQGKRTGSQKGYHAGRKWKNRN